MQLDSQELASCLGLQTGLYYIKREELCKAMNINCSALIPPLRHRQHPKRSSSTTHNVRSDQLTAVDAEKADNNRRQQHVVEAGGSSVVPSSRFT